MGGGGGLVVGAEPADEAALFPGGAFVVEGDEAGEEKCLGLCRLTGSSCVLRMAAE